MLGDGLLPGAGATGEVPPDTELLSGPAQRGFTTTRTAELTWSSPDPVSGWECTLDLQQVACDETGISLTGEDGESDPSPARRSWTVPRNDRSLVADHRWRRGRDRAAYRGSFVRTSRRVAVRLGRHRLGRFDLRTPRRRTRRVIPVAAFDGVRSGELRVVVRSRGRPVLVEGLGVETWYTVPDPG